jgi:hypothetical protein
VFQALLGLTQLASPCAHCSRSDKTASSFQKWETSCAAAALATVLTYSQNDPVSEKLVAQGMLRSTDPIKGARRLFVARHEALR